MQIFDLVVGKNDVNLLDTKPLPDPLYEDNVLVEATLHDLLYYVLYSTVALLIDLRTSLYFNQGNTGVIVFRKVSQIILDDNFSRTVRYSPHVWTIGDSEITETKRGLEFLLPFAYGSKMQIAAQSIEFYVGNAIKIGEIGASLDEGIKDYLQTTPHWESEFEVIAVSKRGES